MPTIINRSGQCTSPPDPAPPAVSGSAIHVEPSDRERAELLAEAARFRRTPVPVSAFFAATTLLLGAYVMAAPVAGQPLSPVAFALAGTVYAITALAFLLFRFGAQPIVDGTYAVTPDGLHVTTAQRSGTVPWILVERVIDTGSAFLIERHLSSPPIVIPKSALADGGVSLWSDFENALIGPRLLVRPNVKSTVIVNTVQTQQRPAEHDH